jgi:hypothetical protein
VSELEEDLIARLTVLEERLEKAEAQAQSVAELQAAIFEKIEEKQAITNRTIYTLIQRIERIEYKTR